MSTVNTELSEFFGPREVSGRERSEFLSASSLCAKTNSPSLFTEFTEFGAELSECSLSNEAVPALPNYR